MEFYLGVGRGRAVIRLFQFPMGWNSTIVEHCQYTQIEKFQFPTGWNSTGKISSWNAYAYGCFNSQRDGILQSPRVQKRHNPIPFQFPTGWNSTDIGINLIGVQIVSIPNGMEFYFIASKLRYFLSSFNSQRDGILQNGTATQNSYE